LLTRRTFLGAGLAGLLALAGFGQRDVRARGGIVARRPHLPPGSVVAFYGDSLTSGVGASSPSARWSTLVCDRCDWIEVNPSLPGLGFVQSRHTDLPATILEARPDAIVVTLGLDDQLLVDTMPDRVRGAIATDFERLRAGAPDAHILVALPLTAYTSVPSQLVTLERWLRVSAATVSAPVIETADWLRGRTDLTIDGTHFNDAGQRRIASLMEPALLSAVRESAVGR
jgi:lysophospholipase L1-like esterase